MDFKKISIKAVSDHIKTLSLNDQVKLIDELSNDNRKGVVKVVDDIKKRKIKLDEEILRVNNMMVYERELYSKNIEIIGGIDEVGRGPLAGPVVTAVVILPKNKIYLNINDSKKVSKKRREELYDEIIESAIDYSFGEASPEEIDEINILNATKLAMKRAIENLKDKPEYLLIDAVVLDDINIEQKSIIKGDEKSVSIAAASILAKVRRDRMMVEYSKKYTGFDFESNKGYGTSKHYDGLDKYGITDIHRKTFVKDYI